MSYLFKRCVATLGPRHDRISLLFFSSRHAFLAVGVCRHRSLACFVSGLEETNFRYACSRDYFDLTRDVVFAWLKKKGQEGEAYLAVSFLVRHGTSTEMCHHRRGTVCD
jgi:hypothetical protein